MPVAFEIKQRYGMDDLLEIMRLLRGKDGCPWDREQDHKSIRKNFIEETYEACEAIDNGDAALLQEELGDVLLQVVFHARMEEEQGSFGFDDVCDGICKKLVVRHPHVFGEISVADSGEVLVNWDRIKQATKGQKTATETLKSVSAALPALMRAEKVKHRASKVGFDYPDLNSALCALESEVAELREAVEHGSPAEIDEELGDLMFAAVNVAHKAKIDPESCLTRATDKFIGRFENVELFAGIHNVDMHTASIEQLNELWREAKSVIGGASGSVEMEVKED